MERTTPTERLQQLLPRLFSEERVTGERYLLFQLSPDFKAALGLEQVWEATVIPTTAITPIPQMPSYILGWNNGRDRVYCLINLAEFLGLETTTKIPQAYSTIVVQVPSNGNNRTLLLGLTVNRIIRTLTVNPESITSPAGGGPAQLTPYLQGELEQEQQRIALLDLVAIKDQIAQS